MKKINYLIILLFILVLGIGAYIIYNETSNKEEKINFNEEEELKEVNDLLSEVGTPLGWLIIVNGIDNMDSDGNYQISRNKDLLADISSRQLFTMEYILSYQNKHSDFVVLAVPSNEVTDDSPTADFTLAYLDYDDFNSYYQKFFEKDFDNSKALKGNTKYDEDYVYYENRRAGSNGVYVSMMTSSSIKYDNNEYQASIEITYSTRAANLIGKETDYGTLKYTKDINNNLILKSFSLNK